MQLPTGSIGLRPQKSSRATLVRDNGVSPKAPACGTVTAPIRSMIRMFLYIQLGGVVLCQIILVACLLTVVIARLPTDLHLVNAAISMIIFSTACSLLLYANAYRGPEPPFGLCLAQACIVYGSLTMASCTVLCLFFQLWDGLCLTFSGTIKSRTALRTFLRVLPWILLLAISLGCLIDGIHHPNEVSRSRDFFYCSGARRISHAFLAVSGGCIFVAVLLEAHIIYMVVFMWRGTTHKRELLPIGSILRMGFCSVYGSFCSAISAAVILSPPDAVRSRNLFFITATLPLAMWLIFWTQKDVLHVWASCIPRRTIRNTKDSNDA